MPNGQQVEPSWRITGANWVTHHPNPRFAIFHPGSSSDAAGKGRGSAGEFGPVALSVNPAFLHGPEENRDQKMSAGD